MLCYQFDIGAAKELCATEPFVDNGGKRILIAGRTRLALDLFGCHIRHCADDDILGLLATRAL